MRVRLASCRKQIQQQQKGGGGSGWERLCPLQPITAHCAHYVPIVPIMAHYGPLCPLCPLWPVVRCAHCAHCCPLCASGRPPTKFPGAFLFVCFVLHPVGGWRNGAIDTHGIAAAIRLIRSRKALRTWTRQRPRGRFSGAHPCRTAGPNRRSRGGETHASRPPPLAQCHHAW
jgi:hypothetical protein